ncbi:MAG: DUF1727 domain-containing protein [Chloroflexota bacterium]|nr:MAG: DUF1727 domain-containing protein [Chloroflexota bacterium]
MTDRIETSVLHKRPGFRPRRMAAVSLAKLAAFASRGLGRGSATALPGLLVDTLDPLFVAAQARQIPLGNVLVTGTNGKTTTSRMIATIMHCAGLDPVHNRAGSNLMRGLATTLLARTTPAGRLSVTRSTAGVFEVDEAVLPQAINAFRPRVIVFTNLFRDQLDRYGELDTIALHWREALSQVPPETVVVLNADDPLVASLGAELHCQIAYYGLEDLGQSEPALSHAADSRWCLNCGSEYDYSAVFYGHLGHYVCPRGDYARPSTQVSASAVELRGIEETRLTLTTPSGPLQINLHLAGLYNVYNALAAATAAMALKTPLSAVSQGLEGSTSAFGRLEKVVIDGRSVYLILSKNPTGLNVVLRTLFREQKRRKVLLILNDNIADGRDVSWIWDVEFERMAGLVEALVVSGTRAEDMALRQKYAGVLGTRWIQDAPNGTPGPGDVPSTFHVEPRIGPALSLTLALSQPGEEIFVLPTYTGMLELRRELARLGYVRDYLAEGRE